MIPNMPVSTLLPPAVRAALIAASQVESRIEPGECRERTVAVDAAVTFARAAHPQFFHRER